MFSIFYKNTLVPNVRNMSFALRNENSKFYIDIKLDDTVIESKEYSTESERTTKLNALKTAIGNVVDIDATL